MPATSATMKSDPRPSGLAQPAARARVGATPPSRPTLRDPGQTDSTGPRRRSPPESPPARRPELESLIGTLREMLAAEYRRGVHDGAADATRRIIAAATGNGAQRAIDRGLCEQRDAAILEALAGG